MDVGVYFDLRNAPGWRQDPARLYAYTLELCEEAERLGAHSVWLSEHHLFDDGYLPQPLTFAAAVAARTTRVRIGTAVLLAPLHSAAEIAEQVAVVDLVSNGRVDLGLGAGYRVPEFELFGADISRRYGLTDGRVRELRALWAEGRVTPAPVQPRGWSRTRMDCVRVVTKPRRAGWPGRSRPSSPTIPTATGPWSRDISPTNSTRTAATWSRGRIPRSRSRSIPKKSAPATPTRRSGRSSTELRRTWRRSCARAPPARRWRRSSSGCRSVRCRRRCARGTCRRSVRSSLR